MRSSLLAGVQVRKAFSLSWGLSCTSYELLTTAQAGDKTRVIIELLLAKGFEGWPTTLTRGLLQIAPGRVTLSPWKARTSDQIARFLQLWQKGRLTGWKGRWFITLLLLLPDFLFITNLNITLPILILIVPGQAKGFVINYLLVGYRLRWFAYSILTGLADSLSRLGLERVAQPYSILRRSQGRKRGND